MKKARYSVGSHPTSFIPYLDDDVGLDDSPLDLSGSHISNRGSTEDLYEFLQRDLLLSSLSSCSSSGSRYSYSRGSRSSRSSSRSSCNKLKRKSMTNKRNTKKKKKERIKIRQSIASEKSIERERRASLATSFEGAMRIEALHGLCRVMDKKNTTWRPPDFACDLDDNHSFLSPKLFHSKKLLNSNTAKIDRKKGPQEIGRVKGFKSPSYAIAPSVDISTNHSFLDEYRPWYPRNKRKDKTKSRRSRRSKLKIKKKKTRKKSRNGGKKAHNRWYSGHRMNMKRKLSTNSLQSFHSECTDCSEYQDDFDGSASVCSGYHDEGGSVDSDDVFRFMTMDFEAKEKTQEKRVNRWDNIDFLQEKSHSFCRQRSRRPIPYTKRARSNTYDIDVDMDCCSHCDDDSPTAPLRLKLKSSNSAHQRRSSKTKKKKKKTKRKKSKSKGNKRNGDYCLRLSEDEKIVALMEDIDEMEIDLDYYKKKKSISKHAKTKAKKAKLNSKRTTKQQEPTPIIQIYRKNKRKSNIHC